MLSPCCCYYDIFASCWIDDADPHPSNSNNLLNLPIHQAFEAVLDLQHTTVNDNTLHAFQ